MLAHVIVLNSGELVSERGFLVTGKEAILIIPRKHSTERSSVEVRSLGLNKDVVNRMLTDGKKVNLPNKLIRTARRALSAQRTINSFASALIELGFNNDPGPMDRLKFTIHR